MARDPYRILQVAHHAEPEVIEAAYKRLARKYHPDVDSSLNATARMQDINWAYDILKDPAKKSSYDRGARPQAPPKPKPPPAKPKPPPPKPPPAQPKPPPPKPKSKPQPQTSRSDTEWRWWAGAAVGIPTLLILFVVYLSDSNDFVPATPRPISTPARATANVPATAEARARALAIYTSVWHPTALPPTFGTPLPTIGTVVVYNEVRADPVWVWTDSGAVAGYIPNGSVCNLVEEQSVQVYHLGEYYPLLEYKIECPSLGVIGWVEAEWTE